jgi:hypothetical protein
MAPGISRACQSSATSDGIISVGVIGLSFGLSEGNFDVRIDTSLSWRANCIVSKQQHSAHPPPRGIPTCVSALGTSQ